MIGHNHLGKNGRFGNQMFQYAVTRGIAAKHNYDWCIPDGPKTDDEFEDEENQHKLFMAFNMGGVKVVNMHPAPYKKEGSFTFDQDLFDNCEDNVNLYGYFQSEKYFKHIEDEIRKDFEWRDDVKKLCQEMFDSIGGKAISLHIRRTDYTVNNNHPLQPMSYYEDALKLFDKNVQILVFSDDPKWCQEQELFADDSVMISEGNDADIDLCLMTKCDYHIIANSSFSWWGAWLGDSEKVVAPSNWFADSCAGKSVKDMEFSDWTWV